MPKIATVTRIGANLELPKEYEDLLVKLAKITPSKRTEYQRKIYGILTFAYSKGYQELSKKQIDFIDKHLIIEHNMQPPKKAESKKKGKVTRKPIHPNFADVTLHGIYTTKANTTSKLTRLDKVLFARFVGRYKYAKTAPKVVPEWRRYITFRKTVGPIPKKAHSITKKHLDIEYIGPNNFMFLDVAGNEVKPNWFRRVLFKLLRV